MLAIQVSKHANEGSKKMASVAHKRTSKILQIFLRNTQTIQVYLKTVHFLLGQYAINDNSHILRVSSYNKSRGFIGS